MALVGPKVKMLKLSKSEKFDVCGAKYSVWLLDLFSRNILADALIRGDHLFQGRDLNIIHANISFTTNCAVYRLS